MRRDAGVDPMTAVTALTSLFGAAKSGVDVGVAAHGLLRQVREGRDAPEVVDAYLLRLALLTVDRNLVLLEGVNTRVQADHHAALFSVAGALDVAPLAALLVNWPAPTDTPELPRNTTEFTRWEAALDRRESQAQLLSHARYIVARTTGLCALSAVDEHARKKLLPGLRLRNIHAAHVRLRQLLSSEDTVAHLIERRDSARPATPSASEGDGR